MIIIEQRKNNFPIFEIYFANKPSILRCFNTTYFQCSALKKQLGYIRTAKFTKTVNLLNDKVDIEFDKNTLYEIRRAIKEEIHCDISVDIPEFVEFYNKFIRDKGLNGELELQKMKNYKKSLLITVAKKKEGECLVYHSYLIDNQIKRVRLLHSASKIYSITDEPSEKAMIGRANRLLHLQRFKELGYEIYDFGGYAHQTNDNMLIGINNFKDSFGGQLVEESNYQSILKHWLKKTLNK